MNCHFSYAELTDTTNLYMQDPLVLIAITIPVIVDVVAEDGDVIDIESSIFGQTTHDRLGNSIIIGC